MHKKPLISTFSVSIILSLLGSLLLFVLIFKSLLNFVALLFGIQ
jgi:hypothetical protein